MVKGGMANRASQSSDSSTSSPFDLSSPPRCSLRKKKDGSLSRDEGLKKKKQRTTSSDTDYWDSKPSTKKTHISSWTKEMAEGYGLFYEKDASGFTDFYDLFGSCKGKSRYGFIYPLNGEDKKLLESLVEQTDEMIEKYGVEMETGWEWTVAADWPFVWTKCCDAVRVLNEIGRPSVYSGRSNMIMENPQSSYGQRGRYRTGQFNYTDQNKNFVQGSRGRRNLRRGYYD